jgi:hypothetical protein
MKKIILVFAILASFINLQSQPLFLKQFDGEGSCWVFRNITYDFQSNNIYLNIGVWRDFIDYKKNPTMPNNVHNYVINGITDDPRMVCANWLISTEPSQFFKSALLTSVEKLPANPDTIWVNISNSFVDSSIHRKIGVFSYSDNPLSKICSIAGLVKYIKNNSVQWQLNSEISWTLDNTDSIYDHNFGWVKSYDYFKGAQIYYHWSDTTTVQQGIRWADPGKINDRLKY